eukprot:COSAG02_NODE_56177_length_286_cov_1.925134_1_plen_43_part_01
MTARHPFGVSSSCLAHSVSAALADGAAVLEQAFVRGTRLRAFG